MPFALDARLNVGAILHCATIWANKPTVNDAKVCATVLTACHFGLWRRNGFLTLALARGSGFEASGVFLFWFFQWHSSERV